MARQERESEMSIKSWESLERREKGSRRGYRFEPDYSSSVLPAVQSQFQLGKRHDTPRDREVRGRREAVVGLVNLVFWDPG